MTAIDRGSVPDWRPIFEEIRRSPWGEVARGVERHVDGGLRDGAHALFRLALARARAGAERAEREEVAARVRRAVKASWMTKARFAKHIGTSASRLSTYLSGKVTPSAAMLLRIEHTGAASHSA